MVFVSTRQFRNRSRMPQTAGITGETTMDATGARPPALRPQDHDPLRDAKPRESSSARCIEELGLILAVECTRHLPTEPVAIETPLERTQGRRLHEPGPGAGAGAAGRPGPAAPLPPAHAHGQGRPPRPLPRPRLPGARCPTTGTSRRSWTSATSSCSTPCWPPAAAPRRRCAS